jgi:glycerol transport system ATP-binding protein
MATIELQNLRHSYVPEPKGPEDYALKHMNFTWKDGGAYALLGPSGCGKSTLLNIISSLVTPSEGKVLFDGRDVTPLTPDQRNIAQVFQFPVIYDTMTVYNNLAFPLKNRGFSKQRIEERVREIAGLLEIEPLLQQRAANLSPDNKQKISMGRGLVRDDVNVIMFDEPLTVIDPHLKWKLRSKLKELHQSVQTEALTFADEVVVMEEGQVVQIGTPVDLFEKPAHTFVGHFIGSPGMNILPAEMNGGGPSFAGTTVPVANPPAKLEGNERLEIGVRPEFVRFARKGESGVPVEVLKTTDTGRYRLVFAQAGETRLHAILPEDESEAPTGRAEVVFDPERTRLYADGWLLEN